MKKILLSLLSLVSLSAFAQDPNLHIYICFGQSNMDGSAEVEEQDRVGVERFKMMASTDFEEPKRECGEWYTAVPPLSQPWVGLSPADYFGREMVAALPEDITIGVISVAIGGCDIRLFDKDLYQDYTASYDADWFRQKIAHYGGNPYQRIIEVARKAQKDGVIKGILMHQGETNNGDEKWPNYVNKVYTDMLEDLNIDVPLFAGEVGNQVQGGKLADMNKIIARLPETIQQSHVVRSDNCPMRSDSIHFNTVGVRIMGRNYAEKVLEVVY